MTPGQSLTQAEAVPYVTEIIRDIGSADPERLAKTLITVLVEHGATFIPTDTHYYGDTPEGRTTIHGTQGVNVEVDGAGKVVGVWFRCANLPFDQTVVDDSRAKELRDLYEIPASNLRAVVIDKRN